MIVPPNINQGHEAFQTPASGPSNVLEYQASGLPFVTQSTAPAAGTTWQLKFPFVTKFFNIKNNGAGTLGVGFTANGTLGTNKFTIAPSSSFQGDIRVMDLFFTTAAGAAPVFEVVAGLTQIPRRNYYVLTGSLTAFSGTQAQLLPLGNKGFGYGPDGPSGGIGNNGAGGGLG